MAKTIQFDESKLSAREVQIMRALMDAYKLGFAAALGESFKTSPSLADMVQDQIAEMMAGNFPDLGFKAVDDG